MNTSYYISLIISIIIMGIGLLSGDICTTIVGGTLLINGSITCLIK